MRFASAPRSRPGAPGPRPGLAAVVCLLALVGAPPARSAETAAEELDAELAEIRLLAREKRYPLALEGLRLAARRIQDLRVLQLAPAFPGPPGGWTATEVFGPPAEDGGFDLRVVATRTYRRDDGGARVEARADLRSPDAPAVGLEGNPLALADEPDARPVEVGPAAGVLRFFPDTGQAELRLLAAGGIVISLSGRGLSSGEQLLELARGFDLALLRSLAAP